MTLAVAEALNQTKLQGVFFQQLVASNFVSTIVLPQSQPLSVVARSENSVTPGVGR